MGSKFGHIWDKWACVRACSLHKLSHCLHISGTWSMLHLFSLPEQYKAKSFSICSWSRLYNIYCIWHKNPPSQNTICTHNWLLYHMHLMRMQYGIISMSIFVGRSVGKIWKILLTGARTHRISQSSQQQCIAMAWTAIYNEHVASAGV